MRTALCLATLALLSACGSHSGPRVSATQEAAQYAARARGDYRPPGPPSDPWGPYIVEAAARFDVPERWVREVMHVESSGHVLDTSPVGAMGLMQVMPATYDELRERYSLGDDPYDPHNNVLAGTAYLREMYDLYGSPGFLAAYNAGPGRLDDYLSHNKPLPEETRRYVARIGPRIADAAPLHPSPASQYAMNQLPVNIPAGPRYPRRTAAPVALAENRGSTSYARQPVQTAALPEPPRQPPQMFASAAPAQSGRGFRLIPQAMADTLPAPHSGPSGGSWAIQVGAFGNQSMARAAAEAARAQAHGSLAAARPTVGSVRTATAVLYRARLTGLSREAAVQACEKLSRGRGNCMVLSPDAQS
jgi:cell division septation protein DedD